MFLTLAYLVGKTIFDKRTDLLCGKVVPLNINNSKILRKPNTKMGLRSTLQCFFWSQI